VLGENKWDQNIYICIEKNVPGELYNNIHPNKCFNHHSSNQKNKTIIIQSKREHSVKGSHITDVQRALGKPEHATKNKGYTDVRKTFLVNHMTALSVC